MKSNKDKSYYLQSRIEEVGRVVSIGDGITWVSGLPSVCMDEVLQIEDGSEALVFQLSKSLVGAILIASTDALRSGLRVTRKGELLKIPVGDEMLGRIIDPMGRPLDDGSPIKTNQRRSIDAQSPPIIDRDFVNRPLYTGNKMIDTMIPIGKGQRQLLIGDNGLGKTSLALDMVLNQREEDVYCVYVLIAQSRSSVLNIINSLKSFDALSYCCIVVAEASSLPGMRFLAPFSGCAVAEYWMHRGKDALLILDDLTMHAHSYRELSLLLRRSPGREAFPPDIFYLHSRLLERASCLNADLGGGSLTAIPIIETKEGELASYIPTNLISITDGQIYFDEQLFSSGFLPAIDLTRSVSRVGGNAQHPLLKKEASKLRLSYLQFLELESFTRFGGKFDEKTALSIQRGKILRRVLIQNRFQTHTLGYHLLWTIAFNEQRLDHLSAEEIELFLKECEEICKKTDFKNEAYLNRDTLVDLLPKTDNKKEPSP